MKTFLSLFCVMFEMNMANTKYYFSSNDSSPDF